VTQPSLPNHLATVAADCSAGDACAPEALVPDSCAATASAALVPAERHTVATTGHSFIDRNIVDPLEVGGYW
jgi:hypothetical protein